jgi:AcrR family transcriptional regulator
MPRDSAATRARILAAAIDEFAAHGLAGARIDRIADAAQANKRSIYVYYGSKDELFTAALKHVIDGVAASVPLDTDDLPSYAGRIFDYFLVNPAVIRMSMWVQLERPDAGPDAAAAYARKVAALGAEGAGIDGLPVSDVVVFISGLTQAWFMSPDSLLASDGLEPRSAARAEVHREALVEAVRRITRG